MAWTHHTCRFADVRGLGERTAATDTTVILADSAAVRPRAFWPMVLAP
ncbi:MAG: hypothetical protein ACK4WM_01320 [Thermoflexales bacterium]